MTSAITSPFVTVPAAAFYGIIGAVVSGVAFNKLTHIAEYTLNKTFGDYQNPMKTRDGRIIVSMPQHKNYYSTQNIVLSAIVATIFWKAVLILTPIGCLTFIATPFLVGCVAAPIFLGLVNMIAGQTCNFRQKWVQISDEEATKHGMVKKVDIEMLDRSACVYCNFGSASKRLPGKYTDDSF